MSTQRCQGQPFCSKLSHHPTIFALDGIDEIDLKMRRQYAPGVGLNFKVLRILHGNLRQRVPDFGLG